MVAPMFKCAAGAFRNHSPSRRRSLLVHPYRAF
jgi:hypothetical protein